MLFQTKSQKTPKTKQKLKTKTNKKAYTINRKLFIIANLNYNLCSMS